MATTVEDTVGPTSTLSVADRPFPTTATTERAAPPSGIPAYTFQTLDGVMYAAPGAEPIAVVETPLGAADRFSPDARYVAIATPGTAVTDAELTIWSTETGEVEQTWTVDSTDLFVWGWSPDSTSVLAATLDVTAPRGGYASSVYRTDGTTEPVADPAPTEPGTPEWYVGPNGTMYASCLPPTTAPPGCSGSPVMLTTSDHQPVLLRVQPGGAGAGIFTSPDTAPTALTGVGAEQYGVQGCGRYALLTTVETFDRGLLGLFDADTQTIVAVPAEPVIVSGSCPAVALDDRQFAFQTPSGPVVVTAEGIVTTVARDGDPLMFSADGSWLLIEDRSLLRTATDGSGGTELSIPISRGCLDVPLGVVIVEGSSEPPRVYDPATDTATPLEAVTTAGNPGFDNECYLSADGAWLQTASTIIGVADKTFALNALPSGPAGGVHWIGGRLEVARR